MSRIAVYFVDLFEATSRLLGADCHLERKVSSQELMADHGRTFGVACHQERAGFLSYEIWGLGCRLTASPLGLIEYLESSRRGSTP